MTTRKLRPCPECGSEDLAIESCSSLCISEVTCNDCPHKFQCGAFEDNIWRHWNKHVRATHAARKSAQEQGHE